jgi:hypothetical protein
MAIFKQIEKPITRAREDKAIFGCATVCALLWLLLISFGVYLLT